MTHRVELQSVSFEEDGALQALADLAQAVPDWGRCRIVGGHMVSLHVEITGADVEHRPTGEADLVAPVQVLAASPLARALRDGLGYTKVAGNRLQRTVGTATATIDLLAPSPTSRPQHNVPAGEFSVDAYPELAFALRSAPVHVTVRARLFSGGQIEPFIVAAPDLTAAIVIKARAGRPKDTVDIDRLLAAAQASGVRLPSPPHDDKDVRLAVDYLHGAFLITAGEQRRLAVETVVPRPEPTAFVDL